MYISFWYFTVVYTTTKNKVRHAFKLKILTKEHNSGKNFILFQFYFIRHTSEEVCGSILRWTK